MTTDADETIYDRVTLWYQRDLGDRIHEPQTTCIICGKALTTTPGQEPVYEGDPATCSDGCFGRLAEILDELCEER